MTAHSDAYESYIHFAVDRLKARQYSQAEENLKLALLENPHSPVIQNLYGILEELQSNDDLARRHYRAAYALDPTYQPALRNLERIVTFEDYRNHSKIDYGDPPENSHSHFHLILDNNRAKYPHKQETE